MYASTVCASPNTGALAGADGLSLFHFCLSAHSLDVFKLFQHKNLHIIYASMFQFNCQSIGQCR
jgi:hypothetical protein